MEEKDQKPLIIILIILIIIVMVILGYFVYRNEKDKRDEARKEIVDPGQKIELENDNRVYPLQIKYYKGVNGCFLTEDDKCVSVFADHYKNDIYYDDFVFAMEEVEVSKDDYLGTYNCDTYSCMTYEVDYDKDIAIIYDNEVIIYNYKKEEITKTGLKLDSKDYDNKIEYAIEDVSIDFLSNTSDTGILLDICYKSKKENNVYSVNKKKFLLEKNFSAVQRVEGDKSGLLYTVSSDDLSYLMKNDAILYEFDSHYICSTDDSIDYLVCNNIKGKRKTYVLDKEKYTKLKEYEDIANYQLIDNFIIFQSDNTLDVKEQFIEIRKKDDLSLFKKIDNVNELEKIKTKEKVFYVGSVGLEDAGDYTSTMILDGMYNTLIDSSSLPETQMKENNGLFSVEIDEENEKIIITSGKEFTFDFKGKKIK